MAAAAAAVTDTQAEKPTQKPITACVPVAAVTLLEDRAHVVRRARLTPPHTGLVKLVIRGVAPVLCDKTLCARIVGDSATARVVDARVRRRAVIAGAGGDRPPGELQEALEQLDDEIAALAAKETGLERRSAGLSEIAERSADEVATDASWGNVEPERWLEQLAELGRQQSRARRELHDLRFELQERRAERGRLQRRIDEHDSPEQHETADLEVELLVTEATEQQLEVGYLVPNACWRPQHTAVLREADSELTFSTDACVWQRTGEDWTDAQLSFSTERASLGTEPPELFTDRLEVRRKSEALIVTTREQQVRTAGLGAGEPAPAPAELPGIDDGGEVVTLAARSPATVPSDGRPYRVPLGSFDSPAEAELVSYPELSPWVLLKTTGSNRSARPILAGPVDLIRQSGLCGRTSVLFIAPGEKLDLGWGPEAELRVMRHVEVYEEDSSRLSFWTTRHHDVQVRLSNIGPHKRRVRITERVPIAEIEKVKIEHHPERTTGGLRPSKHGFIEWSVDLEPFGQATKQLGYTLKKHDDVVGL